MRIIISDSSCLIDLRKANLLTQFLRLPFEVLIPNTLFEDELVSFSDAEKKLLLDLGLGVVDLPGTQVSRAQIVIRENPRLSIHDGFAYVLAESTQDCILLTGDAQLRSLAESSAIEVHGVLWVCEQIVVHQTGTSHEVHAALVRLFHDLAVRLPRRELAQMIKRLEGA
jgi:predicted nucleic acid-binding protein